MKGESVTSGSETRQRKCSVEAIYQLDSVLHSISYGILLKTCIACWEWLVSVSGNNESCLDAYFSLIIYVVIE